MAQDRPQQADARRARRPDQPCREGRQGRAAVQLQRDRRRRRRRRPCRRRAGQGRRSAGGHPQGRRGREEEPHPRPDVRHDDPPRGPPRVLGQHGPAQARLAGHRRHRRRLGPGRRRVGRHPRHPDQDPRLDEPGQRDPGHDRGPAQPALRRGAQRAARHQAAQLHPRPADGGQRGGRAMAGKLRVTQIKSTISHIARNRATVAPWACIGSATGRDPGQPRPTRGHGPRRSSSW